MIGGFGVEGIIAAGALEDGEADFATEYAQGLTTPIATAVRVILDEGAVAGHNRATPAFNPVAGLTRRERDVLALMLEHYTDREIAETLQLTERTVQRDWEKARLLLRALLSPE